MPDLIDIEAFRRQREEFRSDTADGEHASALVFNGLVVHGSLIMAG
jgi:hypothetical protein